VRRAAAACWSPAACTTRSSSGSWNRAARVRVGDPFEPDTTMGALVSRRQVDRVQRLHRGRPADVAHVAARRQRRGRARFFVTPTLFTRRRQLDAHRARGDLRAGGTIIPFDDDAHAVAIANDSDYALAATLWTADADRAHTLAPRIRAGVRRRQRLVAPSTRACPGAGRS
jgi:betaine-aldehyde dehydrogenase